MNIILILLLLFIMRSSYSLLFSSSLYQSKRNIRSTVFNNAAAIKLIEPEKSSLISSLKGWQLVAGRDAIKKTYKFNNFIDAFGFMSKCALVAEKMVIIIIHYYIISSYHN